MDAPSDWLRDIRLAEFEPSAKNLIEDYSHAVTRDQGPAFFQAFTELGAVEFALASMYRVPIAARGYELLMEYASLDAPGFPVIVGHEHAVNSIFKTDCGPWSHHRPKTPEEISMWDIFTFAGDMSKAELLGYPAYSSRIDDPMSIEYLMDAMAKEYYEAGIGHGIVDSGLLAASGIVWYAKATLLTGEMSTAAVSLDFAKRFFGRMSA